MIALRYLGHARQARDLARLVLPAARTGTGRISLAHLRCAAMGLGAEAVHEVLAFLTGLSDRSPENDILPVIDELGHSSGWDILAGIIMACSAEVRSDFLRHCR